MQVAGLALYTGQVDVARPTLEGSRARIGRQIEPDGRQPRELERTRSWDYSEFNIAAFMDLATLGSQVGIDLWNYRTPDGRSIRQALDFMVPYAAGERKWTFDQITTFRAEHDSPDPAPRRGRMEGTEVQSAGGQDRRRQPKAAPDDALKTGSENRGLSDQPRRAFSMVATSIFFIGIIASKARLASAPPAAIASVSTRGVICQLRPQRSLHQPHWLSLPPLPTIAFQ